MGLCPGMPHISIWPQLGSVWDDSTLETVRDLKIWRTLMMFGEVNSKLSSKYLFRWPGHFSLTTWTSNTSPEIVQLGQLYMLRISISCVFLIWLLNLLLNSGRLSDITGWCPKSLAKLVQMSLITRDYEIIFIVNPTNTTGGTTLHQLMVFQFFPLCVSIQFRWPHVHRRCGLMPPPWCLQICIGASRSGIQSSNFDVFVVGFIIPVAKKDGGLTTHLYIL